MSTCDYCGKEISLPYTCGHCGGSFCSKHRLPESHDCPKLDQLVSPREKETSKKESNARNKPYVQLDSVDFEPLVPEPATIQPPTIVDPLQREESLHHIFMNSLEKELGRAYGLEISPGSKQKALDVVWEVSKSKKSKAKKIGFELKSRPKIKGSKELMQLYEQAKSKALDYHWFGFLGNFGDKGREIVLLRLGKTNLPGEVKRTLEKLGVVEYHRAGKIRIHRKPQKLEASKELSFSSLKLEVDWKSREGFITHSVWNHFRKEGNLVAAEITPPALEETNYGRVKSPFQKSESPWKGIKSEKKKPRVDITAMPRDYLKKEQLPEDGDYIGVECKGEQFSNEEKLHQQLNAYPVSFSRFYLALPENRRSRGEEILQEHPDIGLLTVSEGGQVIKREKAEETTIEDPQALDSDS